MADERISNLVGGVAQALGGLPGFLIELAEPGNQVDVRVLLALGLLLWAGISYVIFTTLYFTRRPNFPPPKRETGEIVFASGVVSLVTVGGYLMGTAMVVGFEHMGFFGIFVGILVTLLGYAHA
jgi:hypothetical protein